MRSSIARLVFPLVLTVLGCAGASEPFGNQAATWVPGEYQFESRIRYRDDSNLSTATTTIEIRGDLTVREDGVLILDTSMGPCRRTLTRDAGQRTNRDFRFDCGELDIVLRPRGNVVTGTASMYVPEMIRRRGGCRDYRTNSDGSQTCIAWDWNTTLNRSLKSTRIRASRHG